MKPPFSIPPFSNWSIAFKLTALFLSIILGVFFVATIILGMKWKSLLDKNMTNRGTLINRNAVAHINGSLNHIESLANLYHTLLNSTRHASNADELSAFEAAIKNVRQDTPGDRPLIASSITVILRGDNDETGDYDSFSHSFLTGQSRYRWQLKQQEAATTFPSLVEAIPATPAWIPPDAEENRESCQYIVPLSHPSGTQPRGILIIELSPDALTLMTNSIDQEEAYCYLFDAHNKLLGKSPSALRPIFRAIGQRNGYSIVHVADGSHARLNIFDGHCRNGWKISTALPGDWVGDRLALLLQYVGAILLITVPLAIAVCYLLTRRVTAPLTRLSTAAEAIGSGRFNTTLPPYRGNDEIGQLTKSFEQMQQELAIYLQELKKSFKKQETMESELNIAKTIQSGILPKVESAFIESEPFDLEAVLIPAKGVGGDLYDFFFLDDRRLALIVGDVSGKGIPAALFMSVTQTLQRSIAFRFGQPGEIVTQLNRMLMMNNEATMFVTYFIGVIDTCSGEITYCNAGHNYPVIRRSNGNLVSLDAQHGLPLGIFEGEYSCDRLTLEENDTIILYTDGITEAFNPHQEPFGEIRLKEAIACSMTPDPRKIVSTVLSHMEIFVEGHEQSDDITMLALQMKSNHCPIQGQDPPLLAEW